MTLHEHLIERHTDVHRYTVHVDEENNVATFMMFNLSGQLCGYQQYRPDQGKERRNDERGRYYTYRTSGQIAVFGVETLRYSKPIFLVEGIFSAVRLHNMGFAAIAALSNNPKFLRGWLHCLSRPIYAICDPDDGGKYLKEFGHQSVVCPIGQDLGSMAQTEIDTLLTCFDLT